MNKLTRRLSLVCVAIIFGCFAFCSNAIAKDKSTDQGVVDICSVLNHPALYENKVIRIKGNVFAGVDSTNISANGCSGAISITIKDAFYQRAGIHNFYMKLHSHSGSAIATIVGRYMPSDDPSIGHVLDLQEVVSFNLKN
jgi:hypothetical protein